MLNQAELSPQWPLSLLGLTGNGCGLGALRTLCGEGYPLTSSPPHRSFVKVSVSSLTQEKMGYRLFCTVAGRQEERVGPSGSTSLLFSSMTPFFLEHMWSLSLGAEPGAQLGKIQRQARRPPVYWGLETVVSSRTGQQPEMNWVVHWAKIEDNFDFSHSKILDCMFFCQSLLFILLKTSLALRFLEGTRKLEDCLLSEARCPEFRAECTEHDTWP